MNELDAKNKADELIKKIEAGMDYYGYQEEILSLDYHNAARVFEKIIDKEPSYFLLLPEDFQKNLTLVIKSVRKMPTMLKYIPKYKKGHKDFMVPLFKYVTKPAVLLHMSDSIFMDKTTVFQLVEYTKEYTDKLKLENFAMKKDWEDNHSKEYAFPGFTKDPVIIRKECLEIISKKSKGLYSNKQK